MIHAILGGDYVTHKQAHSIRQKVKPCDGDRAVLTTITGEQMTHKPRLICARENKLPWPVYWEIIHFITFSSLSTALSGFSLSSTLVRRESIRAFCL